MQDQNAQEKEQLVNHLALLQVKIDSANSQILHLGMLVEYLYKTIDESSLDVDLTTYSDWAQKRLEEIKEIAEQEIGKDDLRAQIENQMQQVADKIEL